MKTSQFNDETDIIVNSSPAVIFLWEAKDNWPVEFVSDNILQFGYEKEEFIEGKLKYGDIVHPDDLPRLKKQLNRYCSENTYKGFTQEYRIITKFGETRWVDERTLIRKDSNGKITHFQGIILDITERKKHEEELLLNENRLETLLKLNKMTGYSVSEIIDFSLEEGIKLTKSKIGYIAFLNSSETVLTMHAWSKKAMSECGVNSKQRLYDVENTGLWGDAIRRRKPIITNDYEACETRKGYPEGHVSIKRHMNVPIFDGSKIVALVGVGNKEEDYDTNDVRHLRLLIEGMWKIIQRKELEDSLMIFSKDFEKANNELKSIQSIKKELFDSIGSSQISDRHTSIFDHEAINSINEQQSQVMQDLIRSSEKLKSIIDSMVYMSAESAGKITYYMTYENPEELINDAVLNIILNIDEKNITIEQYIPKNISKLRVDKEKFTDALTRIIFSSIHFTPIAGNIDIKVSEYGNYVYFEVKDNGVGIPEPLASSLFMRFHQFNDIVFDTSWYEVYEELKSNYYIAKNIIEAHKGKVWVESNKGKGTLVKIKLPKF